MTSSTSKHSNFFYRAIAAAAVIGPIGLVAAAGTMPESQETGQFIVYGYGELLGVIAAAVALRAVYNLFFAKARKNVSSQTNYTVAA